MDNDCNQSTISLYTYSLECFLRVVIIADHARDNIQSCRRVMYGFNCTTMDDIRFTLSLTMLAIKLQRACKTIKENILDYTTLITAVIAVKLTIG